MASCMRWKGLVPASALKREEGGCHVHPSTRWSGFRDPAPSHRGARRRNTTPSSPQVLRGKEQISEYLRDVCAREMTHRVEGEVQGENRIAFREACEYPDGVRVLGAQTLELRDGKIVRQVNVEAWDE